MLRIVDFSISAILNLYEFDIPVTSRYTKKMFHFQTNNNTDILNEGKM